VLSWYPGVNLDQLKNLREGGSACLDRAKLRQRACAIAECAKTDVLFDAGDSDESLDGMDFKEPSSTEEPQKTPRVLLITPSLHPPAAMTLSWHLELAMLLRWSWLARQALPDRVRTSLFVLICVELMSCLTTFHSCVLVTLHPKLLSY
jgi:hypothetical protein